MTSHPPTRVLVVDDEPSIIELLGEYLRARGYEVMVAEDGDEALRILERGGIDVVLTDMKMPRLGGLDLLSAIRERALPVATLLMTGFATIDSAIRAMKDGAQDYILKPFKLREVHAAIVKAMDRLRLERETVQLRQFISLFNALPAIVRPVELWDLYQQVCTALVQELRGVSAYIALKDPIAARWCVYAEALATPPSSPLATLSPNPFMGEHANRLEPGFIGGASADVPRLCASPLCWEELVGNDQPGVWLRSNGLCVVWSPIQLQRTPLSPPEDIGCLAFAHSVELGSNAALVVKVYANAVGEVLTRQWLTSLLVRQQGGDPELTALLPTDHEAMAEVQRANLLRLAERMAARMPDIEGKALITAAGLADLERLGLQPTQMGGAGDTGLTALRDAMGASPLARSGVRRADLSLARPILRARDERWDGLGQPKGLQGVEIPLGARRLAPLIWWCWARGGAAYGPAMPLEMARGLLTAQAGRAFDPEAVERLCEVLGEEPLSLKVAPSGPATPPAPR